MHQGIKYLKTIQRLGRSAWICFILLLCNLDPFNVRSRCHLHRGPLWRMLRSEHVHGVSWGIPGFGSIRRVNIGSGTLRLPDLLGQRLNFKLFGITYLVEKINFKSLFQGPLAKWADADGVFNDISMISYFRFLDFCQVERCWTSSIRLEC